MSWSRDDPPVGVKRADEFIRGLDQVFSDPALGDQVHNGEEQPESSFLLMER
jgi:hypothetical protein